MSTKYKIEIIEGCTAFDTKVNSESLIDLPKGQAEEIVDYLLVQVKEAYNRHELCFDDLVRLFQPDDWESDPEQCSQCFDHVQTTIWNI